MGASDGYLGDGLREQIADHPQPNIEGSGRYLMCPQKSVQLWAGPPRSIVREDRREAATHTHMFTKLF